MNVSTVVKNPPPLMKRKTSQEPSAPTTSFRPARAISPNSARHPSPPPPPPETRAAPSPPSPPSEPHSAVSESMSTRNRGYRFTKTLTKLLPFRKGQNYRGLQERLWLFLEEPNSSRWAEIYSYVMALIILASVGTIIAQSIPKYRNLDLWPLLDHIFSILFSVEVAVRFLVTPNRGKFLRNFYNLVDVLSILPYYIEKVWTISEGSYLELIQLLRPILRLLKVTRNFNGFQLLVRSLTISMESLPVPLFMLLIMVVTSGALVYFFENGKNPRIVSIPDAMWFSIVTISTVGYGNTVPVTVAGKVVASIVAIVGVMYMAMPLSIVGSSFTQVWQDRNKILVVQKTKQRLIDLGYSSTNVKEAFNIFDPDGSGAIDMDEFKNMINGMRIGLEEDAIENLFEAFDEDASGEITFDEFAKVMFPEAWTKLKKLKNEEEPEEEDDEEEEEVKNELSTKKEASTRRTRAGSIIKTPFGSIFVPPLSKTPGTEKEKAEKEKEKERLGKRRTQMGSVFSVGPPESGIDMKEVKEFIRSTVDSIVEAKYLQFEESFSEMLASIKKLESLQADRIQRHEEKVKRHLREGLSGRRGQPPSHPFRDTRPRLLSSPELSLVRSLDSFPPRRLSEVSEEQSNLSFLAPDTSQKDAARRTTANVTWDAPNVGIEGGEGIREKTSTSVSPPRKGQEQSKEKPKVSILEQSPAFHDFPGVVEEEDDEENAEERENLKKDKKNKK